MIFVGDIASPTSETTTALYESLGRVSVFKNKCFIGNLEGVLGDVSDLENNMPIVYNHVSIVPVLRDIGFKYLGLANNHILDLQDRIDLTCRTLAEHSIVHSGIVKNYKNRDEWKLVKDSNGSEFWIYNACWNFLLYHQEYKKYSPTVNVLNFGDILSSIESKLIDDSNAALVVYLHWSFDLEKLPLPVYRVWSKRLIESGVRLVVGCHAHCVQGAEKYRNGYIVHGLGNFYFPSNYYANGKLQFPIISKQELAFEYDFITNEATFHWLSEDGIYLRYDGSEKYGNTPILNSFTPYAGLDNKSYIQYYKSNRRKSKFIPVITDYIPEAKYKFQLFLLNSRARIARKLASLGLIKWQS